MTRARLPERVLCLTVLALTGAAQVPPLTASTVLPATAGAVVAMGFAAVLRARRGLIGRAGAGALHAVALLCAAIAEESARPPAELELPPVVARELDPGDGSPAGAWLWLGRVVGCPLPEAGPGRRATLALARIQRATGVDSAPASGPASASGWVPVRGRVEVLTTQPLAPGEWWLVRGTRWRPTGRRNPGGFDGRAQAERLGLAGRIALDRPQAAERLARAPLWRRPDLQLESAITWVRFAAHHALARELRPEAAGLAEAMAFGARGSLTDRTQADFRWLGWSHLVAVSGMNVGFVTGLAAGALGLARVRRRGPILALVLLVHAAVTGGQPPVARATWMAFLGLSARALERSLTGSRALSLSAGLCLASEPTWLGDPSFQLSFGALAGMGLLAPGIDWADPLAIVRGRPGRWILVPLVSGFGAQLGCLPVLATQFHWLSPWGVVTGPIAIPLASGFVSAILVALGLVPLVPPLGHGLASGAAVLGEALLALSRLGARHGGAPWPMAGPGLPALLLFGSAALALGLCGVALGRGGGRRAFGIALAATLFAGWGIVFGLPAKRGAPERVDVIFLDVGQGDSALLLVQGPPGWIDGLGFRRAPQRAIVIDTGDYPRDGFDCGAGIVAPALAALGVRAIDQVFLTHGDRDHAGGFPGLDRWLPVRELIWPAPLTLPPALRAAGDLGSSDLPGGRRVAVRIPPRSPPRLRLAHAGGRFELAPGVSLSVLHPPAAFSGRGNDGSVTLRLQAFGERVLFLGDLEGPGEAALVQAAGGPALAAPVVKVAHHGSSTSSTAPLVGSVQAEVAVVSVGGRNRFGHPSPAVIERWQAGGAEVLRTDRSGAVWVRMTRSGRTLAAGANPSGRAF
jgi:competence protein ComEC